MAHLVRRQTKLSDSSYIVQSPLDAKGCTGQGYVKANDEFRRCGEVSHIYDLGGGEKNALMSHQTGAGFDMLLFHTTELIRYTRLPRKAHVMKMSVPEFLALMCQGAGSSNRPNERPQITANASSRIVAGCTGVVGEAEVCRKVGGSGDIQGQRGLLSATKSDSARLELGTAISHWVGPARNSKRV